jgi:hypothetical protein
VAAKARPMNLRRHLTYANVISTFCLFLVLAGGAAFAATKLAKSSVGTEQLKGEAVTKGKMAPNSVNSKKVVNGSLTGEDIASSTLGKVPSATNAEHADSATTAGSANSASSATNASHATSADTAANAEKLDGHTPGEFGPVLVASTTDEVELEAETEFFFSVSGVFTAEKDADKVSLTLPGRKFKATDFAVSLESQFQVTAGVHVSLVVNGTSQEVCSVTVVPSSCAPTTSSIEIPAGAQLAWKIVSAAPIEARPEFALRLLPG